MEETAITEAPWAPTIDEPLATSLPAEIGTRRP